MKYYVIIIAVCIGFGCKKNIEQSVQNQNTLEESIRLSAIIDTASPIKADTLKVTLTILSKVPPQGLMYKIEAIKSDNNSLIHKIDTNSNQSQIDLVLRNLSIRSLYKINLVITSKSTPSNVITKTYSITRGPVYKNYKVSSYILSNSDSWYSSSDLYKADGSRYLNNPFIDEQSVQLDINSDGIEDVFYFEGYDLNISPTPNPPPSIFLGNGEKLIQTPYSGSSILNPHGTKLLVGDFNNDSLPDVFSNVAVDPPFGAFPFLNDNNHLILNSPSGFSKVIEFLDQGFWYTGCSGDIDNDGDLDVITFNFHNSANRVKSRIMWNDGSANFTIDFSGIGDIPTVYQSELFDVNSDGFLDLVVAYVSNGNPRTNDFRVLWGNGKSYSLTNSTKIDISGEWYLMNIDFVDIDKDKIFEIVPSGNFIQNNINNYFISIFKSSDSGKSFSEKTSQYVENNITTKRFYHIRVQDIDKNGSLDIFSSERKDNLRWEWNGIKFIKK